MLNNGIFQQHTDEEQLIVQYKNLTGTIRKKGNWSFCNNSYLIEKSITPFVVKPFHETSSFYEFLLKARPLA